MNGVWLALWAGCAPVEDGDVPDPHGPLAPSGYRFCHEADAADPASAAWCDALADAPPDVCPGLREACASGGFHAGPQGGCDDVSGDDGPALPAGPPEAVEAPAFRPPDLGLDLGFLAMIARWVAAFSVAAVVVLLVRAAWMARRAARRPVVRSARPLMPADEPVAIAGDDDLPLLPEEVMLAEAERALAAQRFDDAATWARGAALRRLARRGALRLHRARTDWEYVTAMASSPEQQGQLRQVLEAVEAVRWAGRSLPEEAARQAVSGAARILAVVAVLLCLLPAAEARSRYASDGDAAVIGLLRDEGFEIVADGSLQDRLDGADVVVLDAAAWHFADEERSAIRGFVRRGGVLVLAGDPGRLAAHAELRWVRVDDDDGRRVVVEGGLAEGLDAPRMPPNGAVFCSSWRGEPWVVPATEVQVGQAEPVETAGDTADVAEAGGVGSVEVESAEVESADCDPMAVTGFDLRDGYVVAIADVALLSNAAMMFPENRRFLVGAIRLGRASRRAGDLRDAELRVAPILGAVALAPRSPGASMAEAKLLPFIVHLLLAWAVLARWRGVPFLPLRAREVETGRPLVEHAVALGRHWRRAGARREAARALAARWWHGQAGERPLIALRRGGLSAEQADVLLRDVRALVETPDAVDAGRAEQIVEELWKLNRNEHPGR